VGEIDVIYEDENLLAVNKPSGIRTEGGSNSLEDRVRDQLGRDAWCCHRLDTETSGVVLFRKNRRFTREIAAAFERHQVRKCYWAIVQGAWPRDLNRIEHRLKWSAHAPAQIIDETGKPSLTTVRLRGVNTTEDISWVELLLKTGRTHQARIHCAASGHPVVGDGRYGSPGGSGPFGLHARELKLRHPGSGGPLQLVASPPVTWDRWIKQFDMPGDR